MPTKNSTFKIDNVIHHLKHYLPAQAPLKDFVHHNTLHAFQDRPFFLALAEAKEIFGYKTSLSLNEFRDLYKQGKIPDLILEKTILKHGESLSIKDKMMFGKYHENYSGRIGVLRQNWKKLYALDPDLMIHPFLFRFVGHYLDQGVSIWNFPKSDIDFLEAVRFLEKNSFVHLLKSPRAQRLLLNAKTEIEDLLQILIGDETFFEHYIFDQQFAHPGYSGMVAYVEDNPKSLIDGRKITLKELITLECLFEIDALDSKFGENWAPLTHLLDKKPLPLFSEVKPHEYTKIIMLWQEAYEWSHYDQVLGGIVAQKTYHISKEKANFQALFCIDDREGSFRRHVELEDKSSKTYGTPGFFGSAIYYKPMHGKFSMKVCPGPIQPRHLIKEYSENKKNPKDFHFSRHTHSLLFGWIITHTIGFWSAIRLFINIFLPKLSPATTFSFKHMETTSKLTIERLPDMEDGLHVGFLIEEMVDIVETVLKSIGLVEELSPLVYVVGHGASSVNNTHYAGYDCGACSGRPGSVNARTFSYMANHSEVRHLLKTKGIIINGDTLFVAALHDTTRDEIVFYDENFPDINKTSLHKKNKKTFFNALEKNAQERARRFALIDLKLNDKNKHDAVKLRSFSLFEPRPELNHATNSLCIIGDRSLADHLFLDRRAFMNSYDYHLDPDGHLLFSILSAATPVCGGINLEYYFSRVDNAKLGAGSKLPHNVVGLIGISNGVDGDLRPGLPYQMIEVHDPLRLLMIVEQTPEMVLKVIQRSGSLYEWYNNGWINLVAVDPISKKTHFFKQGTFYLYEPIYIPKRVEDITPLLNSERDNLPVLILKK